MPLQVSNFQIISVDDYHVELYNRKMPEWLHYMGKKVKTITSHLQISLFYLWPFLLVTTNQLQSSPIPPSKPKKINACINANMINNYELITREERIMIWWRRNQDREFQKRILQVYNAEGHSWKVIQFIRGANLKGNGSLMMSFLKTSNQHPFVTGLPLCKSQYIYMLWQKK